MKPPRGNENTLVTAFPQTHHASCHGIGYRDMTPLDMAFLARLYRSTREDELARVPWSEAEKSAFIDMQFNAQHQHYQQHYPDALWLVIQQSGVPIGRLYLESWPSEHRIIDIALMPEARGKGIGGAILQDLQDQAADHGKGVGIHVEKENPALSLYHRLGFETREDKGVYWLLEWLPDLAAKSEFAG